MTSLVPSALSIGASILMLVLTRGRSPRAKFFGDVAALALLSTAMWRQGVSPLLDSLETGAAPNDIALVSLVAAWWLFACRAAVSLTRAVLDHDRRSREMRLFSDLLVGGIYLAAALVVLGMVFKLPIGGVVATSGLVAIVVGLALQSTLADLFAGIAVGVEQPFTVGDRVRLSDGTEGRVEQMNWRSIRLRINQDDLAVIPNSTIAKAEIVNRSSPSERGSVRVELPVAASADPDRVFDLLRMATLLAPDILASPPPSTFLLRVGERTNSYAVDFTVENSANSSRARSDVLRHARKQMEADGLLPGSSADCGGRLLRGALIFESLSDEQLAQLEQALRMRRLSADEVLFEEGATESVLYVIAGGVIEVSRAQDGRRELLGRLGAGEYIGEVGLLTGAPRIARATAITDARVYMLDKEALEPVLSDNHELALAFERSVLRGRMLLARSQGAVRSEDPGHHGDLLGHIRHFFRKNVD